MDKKIVRRKMVDLWVRLNWTHKIQEKQSDIYKCTYKTLETIKLIAVSLTSSGIITMLFCDEYWIKVLTAILSLITVFITGYGRTFNLPERTQSHKIYANEFLILKDRVGFFVDDIDLDILNDEDIIHKRNEIQLEFEKVIREAPITTNKAVRKASIALNKKEEAKISEDERIKQFPNYTGEEK